MALHAHHPDWRDVPCVIANEPTPPVRVRRDGLVRALLVLLSAVKREAAGTLRLRGAEEDELLVGPDLAPALADALAATLD